MLTVHVQDVRLDDIFVALSVARVIACVDQSDVVNVERAIGEHFELVLAKLRQVKAVAAPHDRRTRRSRHVALDLDVVADAGHQLVHFQRLVQRHHRDACFYSQGRGKKTQH